jgi:RNA polymerase sigma-70 factor (ECF subfamily)
MIGSWHFALWPRVSPDAGPERLYATLSPERARVAEQDDEHALIARVGSGDEQAYRALAQRYLTPILRYSTRLLGDAVEAEDVVQETFLRLWQQAARYEARGSKPSTWLYRIAHNLCVDRLRRRREVVSDAADANAGGDRASAPLEQKELAAALEHALSALPERQRAAVVLVHHEGMSQGDAAEVLGCGVDAVESLLARGRRSLREQLAQVYAQNAD